MAKVILSHKYLQQLEREGKILPLPHPTVANKAEQIKSARTILADTLHKALRQFEVEGCPEQFDLSVHIDMMLKRLSETGLIPQRDDQGRFAKARWNK